MKSDKFENCAIGVDLGGTKIETALVDDEGRIAVSRRRATNAGDGANAVIAAIEAAVREVLQEARCPALPVGIGVAGQVDRDSGLVRAAPNLEWRDVPLGKTLSEALGASVHVTNDVRAAAWGEWRFGAGKGARDLLCIFVGTGIGGGVVSRGTMMEGHSNTAAEIGHTPLVFGGRKCTCPNTGCLEAYAGGWAIAARAREAAAKDEAGSRALVERAGGLDAIAASDVGALSTEGDAFSEKIMAETVDYLAAGTAGLVNAFNPAVVIFGGGVIEGNPEMIERVEDGARKRALAAAVRDIRFVRAALGNDAGVTGAAAVALHESGGGTSE